MCPPPTHTKAAAATATVSSAVGQASKAMGAMQQQLDPQKMAAQLAGFQRENQKMEVGGVGGGGRGEARVGALHV
jgi:hypothetical protein